MLDSPPSSDPSSSSSVSNNKSLSSNLENEQIPNNEDDEQLMTEEETEICNQIVQNYNKYKNVLRSYISKTNISKLQKDKIKKANTILPKLIHHKASLTEINDFTYAVALTINNNENKTSPQKKKCKREDKIAP